MIIRWGDRIECIYSIFTRSKLTCFASTSTWYLWYVKKNRWGERERERENGAFKIAESQALSLDKINQNILGAETENLDLCNILKGF